MPRADIRVRHFGGDRFSIDIRKHSVVVDQPIDSGGEDTGPTPTEMLIGSLASCVAFYARRFMKRHGLPEQVDVTADWEMGARPSRVHRIDIWVDAPLVPAEKEAQFLKVIEHCTVHNSLMAVPEISIRAHTASGVLLAS